jgi:hypothetical protein
MTAVLTPEALSWVMLMLGLGALSYAAFSVGMMLVRDHREPVRWGRELSESPFPVLEARTARVPRRHFTATRLATATTTPASVSTR